jgi:hypothetical protein
MQPPVFPTAKTKTLKLPDRLEDGVFGDLVVKVLDGVGYLWAPIGPLQNGQTAIMTFTNIPGANPVSGCFTEWDTTNAKPFFGDAYFILSSVQRADGQVRMAGYQAYGTLNGAFGLIAPL